MSLIVHKVLTCDLCNATLIEHRARVYPSQAEFRLEAKCSVDIGYHLDLCEECIAPVREAVKARIEELKQP